MPGHDPARPITRAPYPERAEYIVYPGNGQVYCRCPSKGPAAAYDLTCKGRMACERMGGDPGGVRARGAIVLDRHDRRIFTPIPYTSPSRKRGYRRCTALERINARLDRSFGFDPHFLRGTSRMRTRVRLAPSMMMALAPGQMRGSGARNGCACCTARFPPLSRGQALGRHRLTGPPCQVFPVRPRGSGGRLVCAARAGASCSCTKPRCEVCRPHSESIAPRRTVSLATARHPPVGAKTPQRTCFGAGLGQPCIYRTWYTCGRPLADVAIRG